MLRTCHNRTLLVLLIGLNNDNHLFICSKKTTLDSRQLRVPIDEVITPKYIKHVKGEGMPIYNDKEFTAEGFNKPNKRGDLYIKFDIIFPKNLTEEQKEELRKNLANEN